MLSSRVRVRSKIPEHEMRCPVLSHLQANWHEHMPAGHSKEFLDYSIDLLRVNVLEHVGAKYLHHTNIVSLQNLLETWYLHTEPAIM